MFSGDFDWSMKAMSPWWSWRKLRKGTPGTKIIQQNKPSLKNVSQQDIFELYKTFKSPHQDLVGYKGGHVEKDVLNEVNIPSINWEQWGCPKFETLMEKGFRKQSIVATTFIATDTAPR